jgi:Zn-dependent M28 family amino/carboxypeptidase
MRKELLLAMGIFSFALAQSQNIDQIINPSAVNQIEKLLSADDMRGRGTYTPDIDRAADFIETQFKLAGLQTWNNGNSYRQPFTQVRTRILSAAGGLDGVVLPEGSIVTSVPDARAVIDENSGYEKAFIKAGDNFWEQYSKYVNEDGKRWLVLVDTGFSNFSGPMADHLHGRYKPGRNVVFVFTMLNPVHYHIEVRQEIMESKLANVVGVLPGRSKKNEYVIFGGHYDHLGVGQSDNKGDSIFNGANDDASGTTAVIMLANYFAKMHNNERTLVFVAFTAEEIGGLGSRYFSRQYDPAAVVAMFNIEMIGTESKWGTNSAYITGFEKTDMGKILQKNLTGSQFNFYPDPYPDKGLFFSSDNATLAYKGVPAHSISTSKMDAERYYHKQGDEVGTLDMNNMARIIKAIALSAGTIVAGTDTPTRIDVARLQQ